MESRWWRGQSWRYSLNVREGKAPNGVLEWAEDRWRRSLLETYFASGSVQKALASGELPFAEATYHRILDKEGVVKVAGPHTELSEALWVLELLIQHRIPLADLYREVVPPSIQISIETMYRILDRIKTGITGRHGTALMITPENNPERILVARDLVVSRPELGKPGDLTVPMTYSKPNETAGRRAKRVLQWEVFTRKVIDGTFPADLEPDLIGVVKVADIRAEVYRLALPARVADFSSFKLADYRFADVVDLAGRQAVGGGWRAGVVEMAGMYLNYLHQPVRQMLPELPARLNLELAAAWA